MKAICDAELDEARTDRDAARAEVKWLKGELNEMRTRFDVAKSGRAAYWSQLVTARNEIKHLRAQLDAMADQEVARSQHGEVLQASGLGYIDQVALEILGTFKPPAHCSTGQSSPCKSGTTRSSKKTTTTETSM